MPIGIRCGYNSKPISQPKNRIPLSLLIHKKTSADTQGSAEVGLNIRFYISA